MHKQTVIKLKYGYVLFYESDNVLCVYNKREGLVRFKLQCEALWDVKLCYLR